MEKKNLPVIIRPITGQDEDLFVAFYQSLSDQTQSFFHPHTTDPESLRSLVRGIPASPQARRFMAVVQEDGKEVMAGYVFFWDWHKMVPWFGIATGDRFQGMGLGNQMMGFAIDLAKEAHKGGILLTTMKDKTRAQALYRKFGFELLGEEKERIEYLMILNFIDPKKDDLYVE